MQVDYPKPDSRQVTHVEALRNLGDRLDKQLEREEKILARLRRLEDRVDSILGEDPKSEEVGSRAYVER